MSGKATDQKSEVNWSLTTGAERFALENQLDIADQMAELSVREIVRALKFGFDGNEVTPADSSQY